MRKFLLILAFILLFLTVTGIGLYSYYVSPVDNKRVEKIVEIEKNSTSKNIAKVLKKNNLIKNEMFFVLYLKVNKINDLQAGTYKLNTSMPLKEIVDNIKSGKIYTDDKIRITFKEGINYRGFAKDIENNTNNSYDDVINVLNDKEYLNSLIEDYWFLTDKILDDKIYYPLEGYLFPDTYEFKNKDVTVQEIIKKLLDQMDKVLSPYSSKIEIDKYNVHELLTLASIAEKEVSNKTNEDDRKKVVSVFINRLNKGISLGSDITTRYAIKLDESRPLKKSEYADNSPYNTRNSNNTGFIPSPICMVSKNSIEAVIERIDTNYLYFISNINTGETFFYEYSKDFEAKKQELSKVNGGY